MKKSKQIVVKNITVSVDRLAGGLNTNEIELECGDRGGWGEEKMVWNHFSTAALIFNKVQKDVWAVGHLLVRYDEIWCYRNDHF